MQASFFHSATQLYSLEDIRCFPACWTIPGQREAVYYKHQIAA